MQFSIFTHLRSTYAIKNCREINVIQTIFRQFRCNEINCFHGNLCTQNHQAIIDILNISCIRNSKWFLKDNATSIYVFIKEEGRHTCLGLTIDNRPVDRSSTTVLRKQGCMYIKRTQARHTPHYLRQHTKGYNHLHISFIRTQLFYKISILHLYRLQNRQVMFKCIEFHR